MNDRLQAEFSLCWHRDGHGATQIVDAVCDACADAEVFLNIANLGMIVALVVEDDRPVASLVEHRLSCCFRQIDDGPAAMAERAAAVSRTPAVRCAMPLSEAQISDSLNAPTNPHIRARIFRLPFKCLPIGYRSKLGKNCRWEALPCMLGQTPNSTRTTRLCRVI
jgi:hypothetical protein